jgi:hypothetical protein
VGNAIENRARVELEPLGPPEPGPADGWQVYQVQVVAAEDVAGYPNLLAADLPRRLEALVPTTVADRLGARARWLVVASLVGPGRMRVEAAA